MDKAAVNDFQASLIWQRAHRFVLSVYNYSEYFPPKETCGLTTEFRRAAIAIAMNTAEALGKTNDEKTRSLKTARGSVEQCRYYLILAKDLGYGDHPELMPQLEEVSRMLEQLNQGILSSDL
jgi:four helix bundle protein